MGSPPAPPAVAQTGVQVAALVLTTLVLTALTRGPGLLPVPANWTLANFSAGFSGGGGTALLRSAGLAFTAAILAPLLGSAVAGLARGRWRGPLATLVTLAIAIPMLVIAKVKSAYHVLVSTLISAE